MTNERRTHHRRTPAGSCATKDCHHPRGDHNEGSGQCLTAGCGCTAFKESTGRPEAKKRTVKPKSKTMRKR